MRCIVSLLLLITSIAFGAEPKEQTVVPLWPNGTPGALGQAESDKPTLHLYLEKSRSSLSRMGVVVCPGGSYLNLSMQHEGSEVAAWLNSLGISAFVLQYRLGPRYHYPAQLNDAQRAIRYVRVHAQEWGLDEKQIGIFGFSAGGHLAATAATHFAYSDPVGSDDVSHQSCRPDFAILAYPVITMKEPFVHARSRAALLGEEPTPELIDQLSNELHVTADTPPVFLFHTEDDRVVPVQNSLLFYQGLVQAHVPAELHVYPHGAHGAGLAQTDPSLRSWPSLVHAWLEQLENRSHSSPLVSK